MKAPILYSALLPLALLSGCKNAVISSNEPPNSAPLYARMTDADVQHADRAVQQALESNLSLVSADWHNTQSGNSGAITPLRTYKNVNGFFCRTYREVVKIGRRSETYTDTACRSPKGIWYPI